MSDGDRPKRENAFNALTGYVDLPPRDRPEDDSVSQNALLPTPTSIDLVESELKAKGQDPFQLTYWPVAWVALWVSTRSANCLRRFRQEAGQCGTTLIDGPIAKDALTEFSRAEHFFELAQANENSIALRYGSIQEALDEIVTRAQSDQPTLIGTPIGRAAPTTIPAQSFLALRLVAYGYEIVAWPRSLPLTAKPNADVWSDIRCARADVLDVWPTSDAREARAGLAGLDGAHDNDVDNRPSQLALRDDPFEQKFWAVDLVVVWIMTRSRKKLCEYQTHLQDPGRAIRRGERTILLSEIAALHEIDGNAARDTIANVTDAIDEFMHGAVSKGLSVTAIFHSGGMPEWTRRTVTDLIDYEIFEGGDGLEAQHKVCPTGALSRPTWTHLQCEREQVLALWPENGADKGAVSGDNDETAGKATAPTAHGGRKRQRVREVIARLWPDGVPKTESTKSLRMKVRQQLGPDENTSDSSIDRALGRKKS